MLLRRSERQNAAGPAPWISLNGILASLFVSLSDDAAGFTYNIEYTPDDLEEFVPAAIATPSGTATVTTLRPHGLAASRDCVIVRGTGIAGADGLKPVLAVPSPTTFTYSFPFANGDQLMAADSSEVALLHVFRDPNFLDAALGRYGQTPILTGAVRLNVFALTSGAALLEVLTSESG
jgi:hypothetical protein